MKTVSLRAIVEAHTALTKLLTALDTSNKWDSIDPVERVNMIIDARLAHLSIGRLISGVTVEVKE